MAANKAQVLKCFECNGTGAYDPDCWVCHGSMSIKWRRAVALGWKKEWLYDLGPGDDYCRCPREGCDGDSCVFCDGDGTAAPGDFEQEITRVLVYGLTQRMPPALKRITLANGRTFIHECDRYLSAAAARHVSEKRWGWRLNSILGHEFYLRPIGEIEAQHRYSEWLGWLSEMGFAHWLRWMEAGETRGYWSPPNVIEPERIAQWADDGGAFESRNHHRQIT